MVGAFEGLQDNGLVGFHGLAGELTTRLDALDDSDADRIIDRVYEKVGCRHLILLSLVR